MLREHYNAAMYSAAHSKNGNRTLLRVPNKIVVLYECPQTPNATIVHKSQMKIPFNGFARLRQKPVVRREADWDLRLHWWHW